MTSIFLRHVDTSGGNAKTSNSNLNEKDFADYNTEGDIDADRSFDDLGDVGGDFDGFADMQDFGEMMSY